MNILSVESLSKRFGSGPLLENVTFGLEEGEKTGLIGRNGCGKTTLLRIIAGLEPADGGRIVFANGKHLAFISQNPVFTPGQTVLDAIFDGGTETMRRLRDYESACHELATSGGTDAKLLERVSELSHLLDISGGWGVEAEAKAVLGRLGISDIGARVETLSGGQRKRVAMARGLIQKPDLLILDEPTNHLDADTIAWLEEYLARYVGALLLVTHDRYFLDRVTNRMLEIERGQVQRFEGNYTYYLEKKEEQAIRLEGEARKRENLIRRELAWLRQGAKARSTKQKAHVDRARALLAQPKPTAEKTIELTAASSRLGNKILELAGVSKSYDGRKLIDGFSYKLKRGDRIGIIGPNGSGKTTLLEMIAGRVIPDTGTIEFGETAVVGYFEQEAGTRAERASSTPAATPGTPPPAGTPFRNVTFASSRGVSDAVSDTPVEEQRIIDHIKAVAENIPTADGGTISASRMLELFLFPSATQFTPVGRLSGGERRRLALLRLLMCAPNVLLLDEPTNDFDIATLIALEEWLENFDGCLIVASHDRSFLDRTVDQLYKFEPGGQMRGFPGNYTTYLEITEQERLAQAEQSAAATGSSAKSRQGASATAPAPSVSRTTEAPAGETGPTGSPSARKLSFKEKKELEELESRIAADEARKAAIEAELASPTGDFAAVNALAAELQTINNRLDTDMARWAELAERV